MGVADRLNSSLRAEHLRIDTFMNEKSSSVRITHIPTGLTAECHDRPSRLQNKEQALEDLRVKVEAV